MSAYDELVARLAEQAKLSDRAAGYVALCISLLNHVKVPQEEWEQATKIVAATGYMFTHPGHTGHIGVTVYEIEQGGKIAP